MANIFRQGDTVKFYEATHTVTRTNGPFVYFKNGYCANYQECTLVPKPKFGPGDVVKHARLARLTNGVVLSVKPNDYYEIDWNNSLGICFDPADSLILVRRAVTLEDVRAELKAGRKIEAIKKYRKLYGVGLKEAKDAVEAMNGGFDDGGPYNEPKYKIGDRVETVNDRGDVGVVLGMKDGRYAIQFASLRDSQDGNYLWLDHELCASEPVAIVICKLGNSYRPSVAPCLHPNVESAEAEARRLAVRHPGIDFAVFILASTSAAPKPVVPVAVTVSA